MSRPFATLPRWWLHTVALFALCFCILFSWPEPYSDFPGFYAGFALVGTPELYSIETVEQLVQQVAPGAKDLVTVRPPVNYAIFSLLGPLAFHQALAIWLTLNFAFAGIFVLLYPYRESYFYLATAVYLPLWHAIRIGQDAGFLLAAFAVGLYLIKRDRPAWAGLVLSTMLFKPYTAILFPLLFLRTRRWNLLAGMLAGGAAILVASTTVQGPNWIPAWLNVVLRPETSPVPTAMFSVRLLSHLAGMDALYWIFAVMTGAVAVETGARMRTGPALAVCLAGGILVSPHAYQHDMAFLLPAMLVAFEQPIWLGRAAAGLLLFPLLRLVPGILFSEIVAAASFSMLGALAWVAFRPPTRLVPSTELD